MDNTLNILVVDDEQIVLDSIDKLLRREPYTVHTALNVNEAQAKLAKLDIHIVLTDLMMPDTDGLEFMRLIKEDKPLLPVIMITGYATINTALQATQLGAFDYVAKPFTRKELVAVLRRATELVQATPSGTPAETLVPAQATTAPDMRGRRFKAVGEHAWLMLEENGIVLLGIEHSFLQTVGRIQSMQLPSAGDELRQGSAYVHIISTDLRAHTVLSPLSGTVVEVNEKILDNPELTLQDPFGEGWLIRLKPSRFDLEIKELGL